MMKIIKEARAIIESQTDLNKEERSKLLSLINEYERLESKSKKNNYSRVALWLVLKKIIDYLEELWN